MVLTNETSAHHQAKVAKVMKKLVLKAPTKQP